MSRRALSAMDEADWFVLGLGGAVGALWSMVSIMTEWWPNPARPLWEQILQSLLVWPMAAASFTSRALFDYGGVLAFTFGYGLGSGIVGGALLVLYLRRRA